MFRDIAHLRARQYAIGQKARHHALALIIAFIGPNAMRDGVMDGIKAAAPNPFIISKGWKTAKRTLAACAMAACAVIGEGTAPAGHGKGAHFRIGGDLRWRGGTQPVHHRRHARFRLLHITHHRFTRDPA